MPLDISRNPVDDTIEKVSLYIEELMKNSLDSCYLPIERTLFEHQTAPNIETKAYLKRLQRYCPNTNECYLSIIVYLERIHHVSVSPHSVHRLMLVAYMLASKFFNDTFYTNTRYAKVGGISNTEINILEIQMLDLLDYNLYISMNEFDQCIAKLPSGNKNTQHETANSLLGVGKVPSLLNSPHSTPTSPAEPEFYNPYIVHTQIGKRKKEDNCVVKY